MEALARDSDAARAAGAARGSLVFVGFMGSGKSTAARAVAAELGVVAADSDRELEQRLGEPIEAFFDREGEARFRELEEEVMLALLRPGGPRVISVGGGALNSERVREALRAHTVVHLDVRPDDAWRRASSSGRPLARDRALFDQLHAERAAVYQSAADALLPPGDRDMPRRAVHALLELGRAPAGTRMVWATAASGDYPVYFGRGLLGAGFFHPPGRRFVVTDENVARFYSVDADWSFALPAGERNKTLDTAGRVLREMARAGVARGDLVVALGGGVVGDLAGFCAAVYRRGVPHVQVPTTLVAQVDSAYGGKTGVDLPEAKNYVGAYHQPAAVLVDPATLETLPPAERAAGYAEVVKTALIAGGALWARVGRGGEPDDETILGCLRTKLAVVAEDERDENRRQLLNLGHTAGHALEAATGYGRLRHGEAVGLGLLCALRLSEREQLRRKVSELLAAHGLPLRVEGVTPEEVLPFVARDKKGSVAGVPFVLLERPGEPTLGNRVSDADLRAALAEVCSA